MSPAWPRIDAGHGCGFEPHSGGGARAWLWKSQVVSLSSAGSDSFARKRNAHAAGPRWPAKDQHRFDVRYYCWRAIVPVSDFPNWAGPTPDQAGKRRDGEE